MSSELCLNIDDGECNERPRKSGRGYGNALVMASPGSKDREQNTMYVPQVATA